MHRHKKRPALNIKPSTKQLTKQFKRNLTKSNSQNKNAITKLLKQYKTCSTNHCLDEVVHDYITYRIR